MNPSEVDSCAPVRLNSAVRWLWRSAVCALAAVVSCPPVAYASEVRESSIYFEGRTYHYRFAIDIDAPLEHVRAVVTDYDNLQRINDDVVQSLVLERYDEQHLKRRMWINHCLLVFCFDLYFVENVDLLDDGRIRTTIIPGESNFSHGQSVWRLEALDETSTRISVEANQTPDFWIPPVIGPLVFKRAFILEVRETARSIEREAQRAVTE
jgi:hypothetical protein